MKALVVYYVCTYVIPNNIDASFKLGGIPSKNGEQAEVILDQSFPLVATPPSGYIFREWTTARSVFVASPSSPSTTVYFTAEGWDGVCVGGLAAIYEPATQPISTSTSADANPKSGVTPLDVTFSGTLVRADSGQPLAGMTIQLLVNDNPIGTITTGSDGQFSTIITFQEGNWSLKAKFLGA